MIGVWSDILRFIYKEKSMCEKEINFANLLKKLIEICSVNAPQLSRVINYETSTVYKWIKGDRIPSTNNCIEIAEVLSDYFFTRDEKVLLKIMKLINCYNENDETQKINKADLVEALLESLKVSRIEKKHQMKKEDVPSFFKESKNVFTISSKSQIIEAYSYCFDELLNESNIISNIIIMTGVFDEHVAISDHEAIMFKKVKQLIQLKHGFQIVLFLDKKRQSPLNYVISLINVLSITGTSCNSIRFTESNYGNRLFNKIFVVPNKVAIISSNDDYDINISSLVTYDEETVNSLYLSYKNCLHQFMQVFETVDMCNPNSFFNTIPTGKYYSFSYNVNSTLLNLECLLSGSFGEEFDIIVNCLREYRESWEKYNFSLREIHHILNGESLDKFILHGEFLLNNKTIICSIKTRIMVLEAILNSIKYDDRFNIVLFYDQEVVTAKKISNLIIHGSKKACLKLSEDHANWIRVNDDFFVEGFEKYFVSAFDRFSSSPSNRKEALIEYFENNINWLETKI